MITKFCRWWLKEQQEPQMKIWTKIGAFADNVFVNHGNGDYRPLPETIEMICDRLTELELSSQSHKVEVGEPRSKDNE